MVIRLPGHGLPLNHYQESASRDAFPSAVNPKDLNNKRTILALTTLREFTMLHIMNTITDKSEWRLKVFSDDITKKWKKEALKMPGKDISRAMMDWVIDELRYKAKLYDNIGAVCVYTGHVVKSDTIVPDSLRLELLAAVAKLEDVPDKQKDWHPGSNGQVLDIIHPSLFPLVYGRTRVLPTGRTSLEDCIARCGEGKIIEIPTEEEAFAGDDESDYETFKSPYSQKFQWLPCTVDISGENAKITSYINNLHPVIHKDLYRIIEGVIDAAIPLWDITLGPLRSCDWFKYLRIHYPGGRRDADEVDKKSTDDGVDEEDVSDDEVDKELADSGLFDKTSTDDEEPNQPTDDNDGKEPDDHDDADDDDDDDDGDGDDDDDNDGDDDEESEEEHDPEEVARMMKQPEPGVFQPPTKPEQTLDLKKKYRKRGLQIIVKLANIHLTPENPTYKGGSWHVEGQLNEHICATALYYYSNENIKASNLAFKQQSSTDMVDDMEYPQNFHDWLPHVFGCETEEPGVQVVGSVATTQGRLVTFPNILQHQVQPFSLVDRTKPGHRKILALFLVDPSLPVVTTANVPCQQKDWWRDYTAQLGTGLNRLPVELQDKVYKEAPDGFPFDLEEAKSLRLELMEERKAFAIKQDGVFKGLEFSLCEH